MARIVDGTVSAEVMYLESIEAGTYISAEEMLEYLQNNYLSTDSLRMQWEAIDYGDQEVLLHKAYNQINNLPFTGRPTNASQEEPFPRGDSFTAADLLKVKHAQAELALTFSDIVTAQETAHRISLRRAGVVSYTIGDLSEHYGAMSAESNATLYGLPQQAYRYLSKWLRGGYAICTSIKKHRG